MSAFDPKRTLAVCSGPKPSIFNVDSDNDGTIDANEFKAACGKGLIQGADASTVKSMQGGGNMKPGQE